MDSDTESPRLAPEPPEPLEPWSREPQIRLPYKTVEDCVIHTDVYLPRPKLTAPHHRYPVCLDLHGGAFCLGSSRQVNLDQIEDCLERGWIVLALDHRLCPQVDLLDGPMQDVRDALAWVHGGAFEKELDRWTGEDAGRRRYRPDLERVLAFGTSAGAFLAMTLGFADVPKPPIGIFNMYGPVKLDDPFWTSQVAALAARVPASARDAAHEKRVMEQRPVPTWGGVSLEGQSAGPPDFSEPRQAWTMSHIADGTLMKAIYPSEDWKLIDPISNIHANTPPTFIVHGLEDDMVPIHLSRAYLAALKEAGVACDMVEVPGERHTFAAQMQKGSQTWNFSRLGLDWLDRTCDEIMSGGS